MLAKISHFIVGHKIVSTIVAIIIVGGGYAWYASSRNGTAVTKYVIQKATIGTVVASVQGSGQMQALTTIAVKPQVTETVTGISVKVGDAVTAGQLLVTLDTTNEARALTQAKLSLQSTQLSLAKLTEAPATTTVLQDQNAVTQDEQNVASASSTLGKDYQSGAQMILDHEKVHLARRHGLDLLLARMFFIMNWYNPISFLLIREIRMNHEFEADHDVVSEGIDSYSYQMVLLRSAAGNGRFMMANHFSRNGIMRRISMLNRKKSGRWSCLKVMFLIPFLVILLQVFARPELAGRLQNRRNAVNSPYLVLDREHLAMLGIQSDEQGVYYKNMDPRWKEDHKRYSVLCFFLTEDVYCCNINLNADGEKISGSGHPYSFLRKMPAGNNDFYPLLITSLTVYPTWDAYSVFNDSTIKLLPVQLDMAAMGLRARADTMVFWFKPTQTLRETLAGITNIDRYLRIPRLKRH